MPPDHSYPNPDSIEAEVRGNILAQQLVEGHPEAGTAASLVLPEPLLSRIADRIIRSTFEERFRNVSEDRPGRLAQPANAPVFIDREQWPPLRGYRATLTPGEHVWPRSFPTSDDPPELRRAGVHIATRLAPDGLPRTLADTCDILSPLFRTAPDAGEGRAIDLLKRAGFPIDLLDFFILDSRPLLERVLSRLSRGEPQPSIDAEVARARFDFRQTRSGFHAIDEAGSQPASLFRLQVTRPNHWDGEGGGPKSGDNFDLLLNLLRALPSGRFLLSVHANHADALTASLAAAGADASRLTVLPAELPVSQWAQDNLKPGQIGSERAALLPRHASRAEVGAKLDAGDTAALSHLTAAGIAVVHSPLHFQGGNAMLVRKPTGERLLLVGEAEIARNVTLGLTPEQAGEALRIEMGADVVLVLPAVGFHIDTELSPRVTDGRLLAFVPDEIAAARIVLQSAIRALEIGKYVPRADAKVLRTFLDVGNDRQLATRFAMVFAVAADAGGGVYTSFADVLRAGGAESGPANLFRVMLAVDLLGSRLSEALDPGLDPHTAAYIRAILRSAADRAAMNQALAQAGFRVIPVPSLSNSERSASVINAVQLPDRVLVPVRAGFLKPLDDAAIKVLRSRLPPDVQVVPILAGESERRGGALHCSIAVFPDP